jgi:signal transduction histidine kinase
LKKLSSTGSIEKRLQRLLLLGIGGLLIVAYLLLQYVVVRQLSNQYDQALVSKANALVTLTKQYAQRNEIELEFAGEFMPEFEMVENPEYFQIWFIDGRLLERSDTLNDRDLPHLSSWSKGHRFFNLVLPDGRQGRAIEIVFLSQIEDKEIVPKNQLPDQHRMRLVVAKERVNLDRLLSLIHFSLLVAIFLMLAIVMWIVKRTVKKGLQPIHRVQLQLKSMDADRLASRLSVENTPCELIPLIEQFNSLFARVEASFQREQRFSADVAHELRTPVSELRNLSEVATRWPEDRQLVEKFFQDVLSISVSIQQTINNLLALSRCENGHVELDYQHINLRDLLNASWLRVQAEAQLRGLAFILEGELNYGCHTSINELELILNNLFSNAVAYSQVERNIKATIHVNKGIGHLTLTNETEQLELSDIPLMFDRMWRKDKARTDSRHAGLGLSLVKTYADMLQLNITANLKGNCFSITISGFR